MTITPKNSPRVPGAATWSRRWRDKLLLVGLLILVIAGLAGLAAATGWDETVAALKSLGKPFAFVNIFEDPEIREGLKAYSNWPTFPQLYVNGELVGGCDIVIEMYQSGELKEILDSDADTPTEA